MKNKEYFKPYIIVKNPKIAANMPQLSEHLVRQYPAQKAPDPKSLTSLKIMSAINGKKMSREQLRMKFGIKKILTTKIKNEK